MEIKDLTVKQMIHHFKDRKLSCEEVAKDCLKRAIDSDNNEFITIDEQKTLEFAARSQKKYDGGQPGIIEGVPVAIKDLFCTHGIRTTSGSKMLENFIPEYESTVTANLYANGGVGFGKTNMDEFAMGSANITSYFGPVKSCWKSKDGKDLVPGGSSGGSAAAVAAKIVPAALGSDTGGSIRQPASFTGTVGVKPTYGTCSRYGMVAFASSLDQAGVFANDVEDSALLLESIAGHDAKDSSSMKRGDTNFSSSIGNSLKGLKVGIPKEYITQDLAPDILGLHSKSIEVFKGAGCEIVEISLPCTKYALPAYYIIAPAEASSNLARYDGVRYGHRTKKEVKSLDEMYELTRAEGFGEEVKKRIMIGTYVLSAGYYDAYYLKAQKVRRIISEDFRKAFSEVDAILTPSAPSGAFEIGAKMDDPVMMYMNDVFTVPASLAGLPCMSVPAGLGADGLPIGMQLITKAFDEATMFKVAYGLEKGIA